MPLQSKDITPTRFSPSCSLHACELLLSAAAVRRSRSTTGRTQIRRWNTTLRGLILISARLRRALHPSPESQQELSRQHLSYAMSLASFCEPTGAAKHYQLALQVLNNGHPDIPGVRQSYGHFLLGEGDFSSAERQVTAALHELTALGYGKDHPKIVAAQATCMILEIFRAKGPAAARAEADMLANAAQPKMRSRRRRLAKSPLRRRSTQSQG